MPLHANGKTGAFKLDGLDRSIRRAGADSGRSWVTHGLMMRGVHRHTVRSHDLRKFRAGNDFDVMSGFVARVGLFVLQVPRLLSRQVLDQRAAGFHGQKLHSAANAQNRLALRKCSLKQGKFGGRPGGARAGQRVGRLPIQRRIDVERAPCDDQPVQPRHQGFGIAVIAQTDRHPARIAHGRQVVFPQRMERIARELSRPTGFMIQRQADQGRAARRGWTGKGHAPHHRIMIQGETRIQTDIGPAMQTALQAAREAASCGEVPVGAVVLGPDGSVLAVARNHVEGAHDASAHAELLAMREAAVRLQSPRLTDCTLVVTLEPCPMCAAAIVHFRIGRVVFGAYDSKGGGVEHGPRIFERPSCLHRPEVIGGVCEREASELLKDFFRVLRSASQKSVPDD